VTENAIDISGYTKVNPTSLTSTLNATNNIFIFYYIANSDISYTIRYYLEGTAIKIAEDDIVTGRTMNVSTSVTAKPFAGYTIISNSPLTARLNATANVFVFYYRANTDISYIVHYYLTGTTVKIANDKTVADQVMGASITESAISITGYTAVVPTSITADLNAVNNEFVFYYKANTNEYDLTIVIIGKGTSTPAGGTHSYTSDTVVNLIATPDNGWKFSAWDNTNSDFTISSSVIMTSDKTVTLYFTPPYQAYGFSYSPYTQSGQNPNYGTVISETQIRNHLSMIQPYTQWIRTYGTTNGLEHVGKIAHEMNLQVAAQAWLSKDEVSNQQQITNLINIGKNNEADLLIVGSEVLLRGDLTETQLINYINTVKTAVPGIQVTTADTYGELLAHPNVMAVCDVIMVHYYPFWEGVGLDDAVYKINLWHQQVLSAAGSKSVIVGETGWPSAGNTIGSAVPSVENAQAYFINFVSWARVTNTPYMYFEVFDEPWKTSEGAVGPHWGVWQSDGTLKAGMERVFNGETVVNNWDGDIIGGPGIAEIFFTSVPSIGSSSVLEGTVLHVKPSEYAVVVYIKVGNGWWIKPYDIQPFTAINKDGTWACNIVTGGNDGQATEIAAYLIPKTYNPPIITGLPLPMELDTNAVAKITETR